MALHGDSLTSGEECLVRGVGPSKAASQRDSQGSDVGARTSSLNDILYDVMVDWVFPVGLAALTVVVHAVVAAVAMTGAGKPARQDRESGELVMEYGTGARILSIALGGFPMPIILVALLLDFGALQRETRTWSVIVGFFLLFSLPFTIEFFGVSHRLTRQGLRKRSPWSRKFFSPWEEVRSVRFSVAFDGYIVKTTRGTIRLSKYLRGIDEFRAQMAEREEDALETTFKTSKISEQAYLNKRMEIRQLYGVSFVDEMPDERDA